ncbi:putative DUF3137 domain protein [Campylobacter showae]|uniref:DUF3137 domain-containing protein n=1 Tax=Campylobacter showae RM3277 TaxID=553219 RepID=C6RJ98_9BACT|nr:DUF3137 domain-containing protein [Campylobacter showae]EET78679.1 hypothetical protein CAMSH0001_0200 [Campylobacter showae RM3277]QCD48054.1 putative DUF3137 domain protein [Campylobacter showae]
MLFALPAASNLFAALGEKPARNLSKNAQSSAQSELTAELSELENERVNLVAAVKKATLIALALGVCVGAAIAYLLDAIFGAAIGALAYTFTTMLITASKRREFRTNFKRQIVENIVKKHGLSYDKDRGLGLDDFFTIYDCRVDEWHSEDLVEGDIDGVSVKFSDFYAAKKVKKKNGTETVVQFQGVLFKADFNKKLSSITQIAHVNSRNLAVCGQKANMDDARFEEIFDVYTTDQIGARYALSPALMENFTQLCLRLDAPVNAVLRDSQIFIAVETWRDDFEPDIRKSLINNETIALYESEIASFAQIVKELNLNRKIW